MVFKDILKRPARPSSALNVPGSSTPTSSPGPSPPKRTKFLSFFPRQRKSSSICLVDDIGLDQGREISGTDFVYWPRDLLATDCPQARIITWGYY
jgi:hypothetical protein